MSAAWASILACTLAAAPPSGPEPPAPDSPLVFLARTMVQEKTAGHPFVDAALVEAFSTALEAAATEILHLRRFAVIASPSASDAVCRTTACVREGAKAAGARAALHSRLTRTVNGACVAFVEFEDLDAPAASRREGRDVWPCSAEALAVAGDELGRAITAGPKAPLRATLSVTPLEVVGIDVPDVPSTTLQPTDTSTRPRARRGFSLERALELYKEKHMFVFEDDANPDGYFIAQHGKLVGECEVRRQARAPISSEMREFCEGNRWEWAWAAFPVGALIAVFSADDLGDGGALRFLFGVSLSAVSATLALVLNADAVDLESGRHFSDRKILESIVAHSNNNLREVLDLTEAEVERSGMRR